VPILLRGFIGLCSGALLGLVAGYWVSTGANHPEAPEGLGFWVVAVVFLAEDLFGGLLAKTTIPHEDRTLFHLRPKVWMPIWSRSLPRFFFYFFLK
jgi:hypothetical protein